MFVLPMFVSMAQCDVNEKPIKLNQFYHSGAVGYRTQQEISGIDCWG